MFDDEVLHFQVVLSFGVVAFFTAGDLPQFQWDLLQTKAGIDCSVL